MNTKLRVLIADDERIICDGLKHVIDWEGNGFEIIGMVSNGKEALEACLSLKPEILITDIIMPVMNGLELITDIKKSLPGTKIIILTSYSEFAYAQEAIKLGVDDYILKHSINYEELTRILNKIKEDIYETRLAGRNLIHYDSYDLKSLQHVKGNLLKKLALGYGIYDGDIKHLFDAGGEITGNTISLFAAIDTCKQNSSIDVFERFGALREKKDIYHHADYFIISDNRIGYLLYHNNNMSADHLQQIIFKDVTEILATIKDGCESSAYAAICEKTCSVEKLNEAYNEASAMLAHKFYFPPFSIITFKDIKAFKEMSGENPYTGIEIYKKHIMDSNILLIAENLTGMINLYKEQNVYPEMVIKQCIGFVARCVEFLNEAGGKLEDIYKDEYDAYTLIIRADSIYVVYDVLFDLFKKFISFFTSSLRIKHKRELTSLIRIINEDYNKDITLRDLADKVSVSYNYLATIFKNEIGVSFSEYLINVRIREAEKLLANTNLKIYEISEKVGYQDSAHFGSLFKKIKGLTPLEYRQK